MELIQRIIAFFVGMFSTQTLRLTNPPMTGPVVIKFETLIAAAGCPVGEFGGVYDEKCVAACVAFQQKRRLTADGVCGARTWTELNRAFKAPTVAHPVITHPAVLTPYVAQAGDPTSPHFKLNEWNCHDGHRVPNEYYGNVQNVMNLLEKIRAECGDRAIHLNSGYRSPTYNSSIGGAKHSQHMLANAADITISGLTPDQVHAIADRLNPNGGVGQYNTFTHIDCRAGRSRWDGRTRGGNVEGDEP